MSKELIKAATASINELMPVKVELETVIEWNKNKNYPCSPVSIKFTGTAIEDNSKEIGVFIDKLEAYALDVEKNALDIEDVKTAKKVVAEYGKLITETRKMQTGQFKQTVTNFTNQESRFDVLIGKLKAKEDAINFKEYEKRAVSIKEYLDQKIAEEALDKFLNLDMFRDFVENKKKTNIYTSTGKLAGTFKSAADEVIRVAAEPMLKAEELKQKQQQQTAQFEMYMTNIGTVGNNEELEANIITLKRFKETIENLYPDIVESCNRSIDNRISIIHGNMRVNTAEAEKKATEDADGELLAQAEQFRVKLQDMMLSIEELKSIREQLAAIYPNLKFAASQEIVKSIGVAAAQRIAAIEASTITDTITAASPIPTPEEIKSTPVYLKYVIASQDLNELDNMVIEAENENEAIEKFTQVFKNHLAMVGLVKVEEN